MVDEPELYVMRFPDDPERRAERERQRSESRRRHRGRLALALIELGLSADDAPAWSESLLDRLFVTIPVEGGDPCRCSCHPQLPSTDFHDYGDKCSCQLTAAERRQRWDEWRAADEAASRTPAGMAERARRQTERDEVEDWVAGEPDVVVTRFGGVAPEQWWSSVAGHSFYFRERHECWEIELDLHPTGRTVRAWRGGELDEDDNYTLRDVEKGEVIAEGVADVQGYGRSPLERAQFIVGVVRDHLGRQDCDLHGDQMSAIERALGRRPGWCPACGTRLSHTS